MNTRELNFSGFFTETMEDGTIRYYYQDPFSEIIEELDELSYYVKMQKVLNGGDLLEKVTLN